MNDNVKNKARMALRGGIVAWLGLGLAGATLLAGVGFAVMLVGAVVLTYGYFKDRAA